MTNNIKWETNDVDSVSLPEETYGICSKPSCKNIGELGNGICQRCWDRGASGKSRVNKIEAALPEIVISIPEQIIIVNTKEG